MRTTTRPWHLLAHQPDAIARLAEALRAPPVVAQLLINRGVTEPEAAARFLNVPFKSLYDPALLPGAAAAADRLWAAVSAGEPICVYGDYDVDGLTGTAILVQALRHLGARVDYYVPHRLQEGYGLNREALARIASSGTRTIVTVDCGVAGLAEAEEARRLGLELLITDHHELKERLPDAPVVVHPRVPGGNYPFGDLSGSGVAFKVAWALCQRASGATRVTPQLREFLLDSVALAALGMIADVVPLQDENRIIVRHGLARLDRTGSVGLRALLRAAGLDPSAPVTTTDVSFAVAPRLNAAGRLGCARLVVELFTTASAEHATELARVLDGQNAQRQQIERRILEQARELADADGDGTPALVLASPDWHPGVIGIVAGRLAELYARPVLLIAQNGADLGHGSGRSIPGFPLHQALNACGDGLVSHGGHAAAVGFRIPHPLVDEFRQKFYAYARRHFESAAPAPPRIVIDAELPLSAVTPGLLDALGQLEPYGVGNPRPRFLAGPLEIVGAPRRVGRGERHLQFRVRQHGRAIHAIAFNLGDRARELEPGGSCCVVFTPAYNHWQGYRSVQLEVADFQPGPRARLEADA